MATEFLTAAAGIALGLLAATLVAVCFVRRAAWVAITCVLLAAAALVAASAAARGDSRVPEPVAVAIDGGERVTLDFVLAGLPREGAYGHRLPATLTAIDGVPATAPVLVFADLPEGSPGIGVAMRVTAALEPTSSGDDVVALAFAKGPVELVAGAHPVLEVGNHLRAKFIETARQLPGSGAMLVPGLAVGDESLVDDELDRAMKASSITHLTAVSGSNIAIIVVGVVGLGRLCGWSRPVRIAAAGFVLAGFVLLVTPQGSVIRAAAMAVIVLALEAVSRPVAGVPVLALAVIVLLVADPWLSHDYGFALSAAATGGLLIGTRPVAKWLELWLPPPIALLIAVPMVAQLACQPILLMLDATLPVYGVVANLLAAPAAPIATVVGLGACLIGAIAPPVGLAIAWVAWLPAQWIALIAETVDQLPAASVPWLAGPFGVLSWVALCVAVWLALRRRTPLPVRKALAVGLAFALLFATTQITLTNLRRPVDWRVVACDIGQGDALLVRSGDATVLIDTGEDTELLHACFAEFGIDRIDLLVLSHFDIDHSGAVGELRIPVTAAWLPDTEEARREPVTTLLEGAGIAVYFGARGDSLELGDLQWRVLSPKRSSDGGPSFAEGNDSSLTLLAEPTASCVASCLSLIVLGDLGESAQSPLLGEPVAADIVKVSHHGSRDQNAALYAEISAAVGLISVGEGNGYGHPTEDALGMLATSGTASFRTDTQGHLAVFGDRDNIQIWTSRSELSR
ncbi:ComEC/Rec2 family competence protein [Gulosibacter molinativorax]|uniref:ComEC/Rec2 family competence protein n=1 Tax=Gulosibacter molinativorax TaxID=256821 RepID=UPI0004007198|nr:ComEC/Rec2 family competence protein [Gulosibacter molinativorax]